MGSSSPGLHPLDARSKTPPKSWNATCRQTLPKFPGRAKLLSVTQDPTRSCLGRILKSPGNLASAPITLASRIIRVFVCVPKQRSSFAFPTILGAEFNQLPEDMRPAGWTARIHSRGLSDTSTCFHLRVPFYPTMTTVVSETISVPIPLSLPLQGEWTQPDA